MILSISTHFWFGFINKWKNCNFSFEHLWFIADWVQWHRRAKGLDKCSTIFCYGKLLWIFFIGPILEGDLNLLQTYPRRAICFSTSVVQKIHKRTVEEVIYSLLNFWYIGCSLCDLSKIFVSENFTSYRMSSVLDLQEVQKIYLNSVLSFWQVK